MSIDPVTSPDDLAARVREACENRPLIDDHGFRMVADIEALAALADLLARCKDAEARVAVLEDSLQEIVRMDVVVTPSHLRELARDALGVFWEEQT